MLNTEPNDSSYWREFEKVNISHSAAHYLMTIDTLRNKFGYARVTDIARQLEVSRGAVSMAVSQLKKRKLVTEDPNRFLLLSDEGERIVKRVKQNFRILASFFEEILGVSPEVAQADACKMEHLVSLETGRRLVWMMRFILSNPERAGLLREAMTHFSGGCDADAACPLSKGADNELPCQDFCGRSIEESPDA